MLPGYQGIFYFDFDKTKLKKITIYSWISKYLWKIKKNFRQFFSMWGPNQNSVQPFWRLLDTNGQTDLQTSKQSRFIVKACESIEIEAKFRFSYFISWSVPCILIVKMLSSPLFEMEDIGNILKLGYITIIEAKCCKCSLISLLK